MVSKTKIEVDKKTIQSLFEQAGIEGVSEIVPLGEGEYNAVYAATTTTNEYVIKISPPDRISTLTYEKNMLSSELYWYRELKEHTDISIPHIYHSDFSKKLLPSPYIIMEKVKGTPLDKMDFNDHEKEAALAEKARMLAQIHRIKNNKFGYVQGGLFDTWHQAIRSMASAVLQDGLKKGHRSRRGERLLTYIDLNKEILEGVECSMVNYDLWDPNILCRRETGGVTYTWIDPERSCWGDRIADFVCLEPLTPLEEKVSSFKAYNSVADQPMRITPEERVRYAVALGYLALILEVEKYYRYSPLHFGWWRNTIASKLAYRQSLQDLKKWSRQ